MRVLAASLALALAGPTAAVADDISDQIDQAKQAYQQGDIAGAVSDLDFAMQALKGKLGEAYQATFPDPPDGWTADPVKAGEGGAAMPFLGGGTAISRTYRQTGGTGSIEAQLMSGGSFMQGLASMLMSPQILAAQPNAKRIRVGRENAVVTYNPEDRSGQLTLGIGGKISIMLQGHDLAGSDPMVALINKWDLKKVKDIAGD
jgi:hypothetical protein